MWGRWLDTSDEDEWIKGSYNFCAVKINKAPILDKQKQTISSVTFSESLLKLFLFRVMVHRFVTALRA